MVKKSFIHKIMSNILLKQSICTPFNMSILETIETKFKSFFIKKTSIIK